MEERIDAIIHTPTRESVDELMEFLKGIGFAEIETEQRKHAWTRHGSETCYRITIDGNRDRINYSNRRGYLDSRSDYAFVPDELYCISVDEFVSWYSGENTEAEITPADTDAVKKLLFG